MTWEGSCPLVMANKSGLQPAAAASLSSTGPQRTKGGLSKLQLPYMDKGREAGWSLPPLCVPWQVLAAASLGIL